MPARFLLEKVPVQCLGVIANDPFLLPAKKFPSSIPAEEQPRLRKEITEALVKEVLPAYLDFANFIAKEYAPSGRTTLAVTSLPGGTKRYLNDIRSRTTVSNFTPEQIHQIGLREIDRIEAQMLEIAKGQGFQDLASFRGSLQTNPRYHPTSAEAIVEDFRKYLAQMQPKLPELFGFIPGLPLTVEPMPDFEPGNATHNQSGTPDGMRPGRVAPASTLVCSAVWKVTLLLQALAQLHHPQHAQRHHARSRPHRITRIGATARASRPVRGNGDIPRRTRRPGRALRDKCPPGYKRWSPRRTIDALVSWSAQSRMR